MGATVVDTPTLPYLPRNSTLPDHLARFSAATDPVRSTAGPRLGDGALRFNLVWSAPTPAATLNVFFMATAAFATIDFQAGNQPVGGAIVGSSVLPGAGGDRGRSFIIRGPRQMTLREEVRGSGDVPSPEPSRRAIHAWATPS